MPLFIDFEASSLYPGSWPIEIGFAWIADDDRVVSESKLIRPHPTWSDDDWLAASEAVHRIPRSTLDGAEDAVSVATWAVEMISDHHLISDASEHDQMWLNRLLATLPSPPDLIIRDFHNAAYVAFTQKNDPVSAALDAVYEKRVRRRLKHRAAPDAEDLAYQWRAGLRKARNGI